MKKTKIAERMSKFTPSTSFLALNPALKQADPESRSLANEFLGQNRPNIAERPSKPGKRRKQMNLTEREFSMVLDRQKRDGEIESWEYEKLTLRWGELDNIQYTPDFTVEVSSELFGEDNYPHIRLVFAEVKGAHIWPKDIQKFKAARNQFPRYEFQLWQKKNHEWKQLL